MSNGGDDSGQHQSQDHTSPRDHLGWFIARSLAHAGATHDFRNFMRTRRVGSRCTISVLGEATTLTAGSEATDNAPDPVQEHACWEQLRAAVRTARDGDTTKAGGMLPTEITAAEWVVNGQRVRIRRPGTTTRALRCARRKLGALTPLPVLTALSQPLAGGATAAGILLAPIPLTVPHDPPPYSMPLPGRALTGDVYRPAPYAIPSAHPATPTTGPAAPLLPALPTRKPLILAPGDSAEPDTAPTPRTYTPQPSTPAPSTQRTAPTVPTALPKPSTTATVAPTPSPSVTDLLDGASPSPTPSTSTPTPTVSPSPVTTRTLKYHHLRHKHPLHRAHRRN